MKAPNRQPALFLLLIFFANPYVFGQFGGQAGFAQVGGQAGIGSVGTRVASPSVSETPTTTGTIV